eukprot:PhM_4_TR15183/c0_g1_i1/m.41416
MSSSMSFTWIVVVCVTFVPPAASLPSSGDVGMPPPSGEEDSAIASEVGTAGGTAASAVVAVDASFSPTACTYAHREPAAHDDGDDDVKSEHTVCERRLSAVGPNSFHSRTYATLPSVMMTCCEGMRCTVVISASYAWSTQPGSWRVPGAADDDDDEGSGIGSHALALSTCACRSPHACPLAHDAVKRKSRHSVGTIVEAGGGTPGLPCSSCWRCVSPVVLTILEFGTRMISFVSGCRADVCTAVDSCWAGTGDCCPAPALPAAVAVVAAVVAVFCWRWCGIGGDCCCCCCCCWWLKSCCCVKM